MTKPLGRRISGASTRSGAVRKTGDLPRRSNEQLRLELEHLAEALEEERRLFEASPLPELRLDHAFRIQAANLAAAELLNESPEGLRGRFIRAFVEQQSRAALASQLSHVSAGDSTECRELVIARRDGSTIPVQLFTRKSGEGAGLFQAAIVDLRERERERTQHRELLDAEQRSRNDAIAKDKFIAMLSHELRTPLTPALAAASSLAGQTDLPAETRKLLEIVQRSLVAEARLVDDLLDVSRIVSAKMRVVKEPIDLHQLVLELSDAAHDDAEKKRIGIELTLSATSHHVNADPLRMRQVLSNLLNNALKFTGEGGTIHIASWNNEGRLALEIADNGMGIEQEALEHIFEPFSQVEGRRAAQGGLGLGLAITKGLLELHGGSITAASRGRGHGARFVMELVTIGAPAVTHKPIVAEAVAPPAETESVRKRRILLVEDDPDTAEVMTWALNGSGYEVEAARSLKSALDVDLDRVDLIVSDLGLPDGTGLELIRKLQRDGHKPAIALSGFGMESDVKASKEAGFDVHLTKPVKVEQLVKAIESLPVGG